MDTNVRQRRFCYMERFSLDSTCIVSLQSLITSLLGRTLRALDEGFWCRIVVGVEGFPSAATIRSSRSSCCLYQRRISNYKRTEIGSGPINKSSSQA